MEDENYRNLVVSRLNKTLDQKIGPDEHIDDVVSHSLSVIDYRAGFISFSGDIAVRHAARVERNAEIASGHYCRIGADVREPGLRRHGLSVPVIGNSSHSLLDKRLGGR